MVLSVLYLKEEGQIPSFKLKKNQVNKTLEISKPEAIKNQTMKWVQQYSREIGQIQNDPVAAELRMRAVAQSLNQNDFAQLEKIILDTSLNQDDRFVALTLLSWSKDSTVAETLVDIATTPFDSILNPNQKGDFEKILRMSAVEGLGEIPLQPYQREEYLNQILEKSELEPVADRAMRSLWAEKKLAQSAADQDQEALEKLLSSP